jgi:hypothetical protein
MGRPRSPKVVVHLHSEASSKPESVTLKLSLPPEVKRVLLVEALGRNCTVGDVVAELVRSSPRRFVLQDRGVRSARTEVPSEPETPASLQLRGESAPYGADSSEVA